MTMKAIKRRTDDKETEYFNLRQIKAGAVSERKTLHHTEYLEQTTRSFKLSLGKDLIFYEIQQLDSREIFYVVIEQENYKYLESYHKLSKESESAIML